MMEGREAEVASTALIGSTATGEPREIRND